MTRVIATLLSVLLATILASASASSPPPSRGLEAMGAAACAETEAFCEKTILRALREDAQNVPPGWYHDGTKWIDFDGSISHRHPLFAERIDALVEEMNKEIEFENALRAEARDAARVTTRVETDAEVFGTTPRDETVSAA